MATIITRAGKGSFLTNNEVDANFTNLNDDIATRLLSNSYTAADVLSKLLTVDGTGSGLDADLLRGLDSSSSNTPDTVVVRDSSGDIAVNEVTGNLIGISDSAIDLIGGAANRIVVQDNINSTSFITAPITTNYILRWTDTGFQWTPEGSGAVGGGGDSVFLENDNVVSENYTITTGKNAVSAGPITISDGVTITVPDGSVWSIV